MPKILRIKSVLSITGLSHSTIYLYVQTNKFPRPIKLGVRAVGWLDEDIQKWLQERLEQRG